VPSAYWKPRHVAEERWRPGNRFLSFRAKSRNLEIDRHKARDVSTSLDMTNAYFVTFERNYRLEVRIMQGPRIIGR
jgi:hypothetical protein